MGAKTWMLVYSNGDAAKSLKKDAQLDRVKTIELVEKLFPQEKLTQAEDGYLSHTCPADNLIYAGYFPGVFVVAAREFAIDYPSKLNSSFLNLGFGNTIYLHAMHSAVDWLGFAVWKSGKLARALSLSPDSGVMEDIGEKLHFEIPFWSGSHPAIDPEDEEEDETQYPFPFHPLELGEAALKEFFGYILEGIHDPRLIDPEGIRLVGFTRAKKPKWKFWKRMRCSETLHGLGLFLILPGKLG